MEQMSGDKRRALELSHAHVMPGRVDTFRALGIPLVIGRREGPCIWDLDGHRLIDLHINGGVFNLGHRHPEVLAALREALETLDVGNHHFPSLARAELGERLAALTPGDLRYTVYAASGSEASDIAIKTARHATGRRRIVGIEAGYHGRTGLSGEVGDNAAARFFLSDHPDEFGAVPFNDLAAMEAALASGDVAAVLVETLPATYGFPVPREGYLRGVKQLCKRHGTLYVADEVQTGLARSGRMWAVECHGVEPDILLVGKGLSGGVYPIAAAVLTGAVAGWLTENPWGHVSTFAGAEVGCRVGIKVLEICARPETAASVARIATRLGDGFRALQAREPFLVEVRQQGIIFGLRFDDPRGAMRMSKALYDRGAWAMFAGFDPSVLQVKPGLLYDDATCDEILEIFGKAIPAASEASVAGGSG